jgi:histidinol-phosphate aminotransferase
LSGPQPLPWLAGLAPAAHGSNIQPGVLDFSANGNVIGPSPRVWEAIRSLDLSRYPDPASIELRTTLATRHRVPLDQVLVGNGSTELIWALARAYLAHGDRALVIAPTYGEYAVATAATGAHPLTWPDRLMSARMPGGHLPAVDASALTETLVAERPKLVWLCHPNNPTGRPFPLADLRTLVTQRPEILWIVDEAYLSLTDLESALPFVAGGSLVVLRSLTKDLGLAGLRLGYAIAPAPVAAILRRILPPWDVSSIAQAGGAAALADVEHFERARVEVTKARTHLVEGLQCIGLNPFPSVTNFVLISVGSADRTCAALLGKGFAVRDCTSFGLPDCIRIGVRPLADQSLLLEALQEVLP